MVPVVPVVPVDFVKGTWENVYQPHPPVALDPNIPGNVLVLAEHQAAPGGERAGERIRIEPCADLAAPNLR